MSNEEIKELFKETAKCHMWLEELKKIPCYGIEAQKKALEEANDMFYKKFTEVKNLGLETKYHECALDLKWEVKQWQLMKSRGY